MRVDVAINPAFRRAAEWKANGISNIHPRVLEGEGKETELAVKERG